jgi:hypothetical protein
MISLGMLLFVISCHQQESRVIPDISGFKTIALDTVQLHLDKIINETSGIVKIGETFWTHNDSGGEPALYQFDPLSGHIIRTVMVKGAKNNDWEELASDSTYVYIGDFGNNLGNRKNLVIYKVLIADVLSQEMVEAEKIHFSYPDQNTFFNGYNHNHDAESMVAYGDSLYLFSKNWQNMRSKLYSLPKSAGTYDAHLISEFDSRGTLTAATLSDNGLSLFLLGYNPGNGFQPFIWIIEDWNENNFFSGTKERYNFSVNLQTEAIIMANDSTLFISSENEDGEFPSLYSFSL